MTELFKKYITIIKTKTRLGEKSIAISETNIKNSVIEITLKIPALKKDKFGKDTN